MRVRNLSEMSVNNRLLLLYYIGYVVALLVVLGVVVEQSISRELDRAEHEANDNAAEAIKWHVLYRQSLSEKQTRRDLKATSESDTSAAPGRE